MSGRSASMVTRLVDRVLPRMPDFYGLINDQCRLTAESMDVFLEFMETGEPAAGHRVREYEKRGDELKRRHFDILNHAFATPMDREDIYRAIVTIDEILNYAKTTVREMEALEMPPDRHMAEMVRLLRDGTIALKEGYARLVTNPAEAETYADAARKAERSTEKVYRAALAELFDAQPYIEALKRKEVNADVAAFSHVVEMFKRRELYRHLSNTSDRLEHAGGVLHDILVQIT